MDRVFLYESLLRRNEIEPFVKQMVTSDEKSITYDNIVRKKQHDRHSEKFHKIFQSLDWHQGTVICVIDSIGKDFSLWATQTWSNHYLGSFSRTTAIETDDSKKQSDFLYSKGIVFHHDNDK